MSFTSASIEEFQAHLDAFTNCTDADLVQLRRNVEQRHTTGGTIFRHLLRELSSCLEQEGSVMDALEQEAYQASSAQVWGVGGERRRDDWFQVMGGRGGGAGPSQCPSPRSSGTRDPDASVCAHLVRMVRHRGVRCTKRFSVR